MAVAADALPAWLRPFVWSDVLFTYERSLTGGRLPYLDVPFEYPPLIALLSAVLARIAWGAALYVTAWGLVLALTAAGAAYALAGRAPLARVLICWSLAPQLVLLAGLNFDVLPAAFVALAMLVRPIGAGALVGLATAAKLYPIVTLPFAAAGRTAAWTACAVVLAVLYAPSLALPYTSARGIGAYAASAGANVDSVWRLPQALLGAAGMPDPGLAVLVVTVAGLLLTYVFVVLPCGNGARGYALATVAVLIWSPLHSPQYAIWLLPFFALLPLRWRTFVWLTIADVGVFFTVSPLTLVPWPAGAMEPAMLLALVTAFVAAREVVLVVLLRELAAGPDRVAARAASFP